MTLLPWEYLFESFNAPQLPGPVPRPRGSRRWCCSSCSASCTTCGRGPCTATAPYADMWEWMWWTGLITFSMLVIEALFVFDFILVLITAIIGLGDARLGALRPLPADARAPMSSGSLASATTRSRSSRTPRPRSAAAAARRLAAPPPPLGATTPTGPPMPIEIRRFGVGHRRADGPPGTTGVRGQMIHSDGRGTVTELAFARAAPDRAARQPEHDVVCRDRGRRLGRRRRRADPGGGRRSRPVAIRHPARGLDRALGDARVRGRVQRTDDGTPGWPSRGAPRRIRRRPANIGRPRPIEPDAGEPA